MNRRFNELIKDFNRIRFYAREFYINGFKHREEFQEKSLRSYDNERRRIESYLNHYIQIEQTSKGKTFRLALNQEPLSTNPFFTLWQTKSFTKNDIFLHFILLDCLNMNQSFSLTSLTEEIHKTYLSHFEETVTFSEITVRNKLKEYCQLGLVQESKKENKRSYQLTPPLSLNQQMIPVLHFFKEVLPGGVIGQFLLNQMEKTSESPFVFKHHFFVHTLDEELVLTSLKAIKGQRYLQIVTYNQKKSTLIPLSLYVSTETGRQYLIGFIRRKHLSSIRIDQLKEATLGSAIKEYEQYHQQFLAQKKTSWNGNFNQGSLKQLRVLLQIEAGSEDYLLNRIAREQRMGTSYRIDDTTVAFEIELIDLFAINPFLRTFIGRILSIESSDKQWKQLFVNDMKKLIALYDRPKEKNTNDK